MLTRVIFGERARFRRCTCDRASLHLHVLEAWWMPVICSGAKQMQASTRKRRTAYLRNASGGIVGKMLNKPPDLRSPDVPSLLKNAPGEAAKCSAPGCSEDERQDPSARRGHIGMRGGEMLCSLLLRQQASHRPAPRPQLPTSCPPHSASRCLACAASSSHRRRSGPRRP